LDIQLSRFQGKPWKDFGTATRFGAFGRADKLADLLRGGTAVEDRIMEAWQGREGIREF